MQKNTADVVACKAVLIGVDWYFLPVQGPDEMAQAEARQRFGTGRYYSHRLIGSPRAFLRESEKRHSSSNS